MGGDDPSGFWVRDLRLEADTAEEAIEKVFLRYPHAQNPKIWPLTHTRCSKPLWQVTFIFLEPS